MRHIAHKAIALASIATFALLGVSFNSTAQASARRPRVPSYQSALIQYQSYQRSSQDAPCTSPPLVLSTWQDGWTDPTNPLSGPTWHQAWEQWPNGNTGGWTCTRAITWAHQDIAPPG